MGSSSLEDIRLEWKYFYDVSSEESEDVPMKYACKQDSDVVAAWRVTNHVGMFYEQDPHSVILNEDDIVRYEESDNFDDMTLIYSFKYFPKPPKATLVYTAVKEELRRDSAPISRELFLNVNRDYIKEVVDEMSSIISCSTMFTADLVDAFFAYVDFDKDFCARFGMEFSDCVSDENYVWRVKLAECAYNEVMGLKLYL